MLGTAAVEMLRASAVAPAGADHGVFEACASAWTSVTSAGHGPTRFSRTAFDKTVETKPRVPLLWQHQDTEICGVAALRVNEVGLIATCKLALKTRRGSEAFELLKLGALTDVSIGFCVVTSHSETDGARSIRVVDEAEVAEVSAVSFGADKAAKVAWVHAAPGSPPLQTVNRVVLMGLAQDRAAVLFPNGNDWGRREYEAARTYARWLNPRG